MHLFYYFYLFYRLFLVDDANLPPRPLTKVYPEHIADGKADSSSEEKNLYNRGDYSSSKITSPKISIEDFELVRVIGKGSFGWRFKCYFNVYNS